VSLPPAEAAHLRKQTDLPKIRHQRMRDGWKRSFARSPEWAKRLEGTRYKQIVDAAFECGAVLYGVWTWDRLIKIGYTEQIWQRLGAYGINQTNAADRVLFIAPGSYDEEQIVHHILRGHLSRGHEYYEPVEEVWQIVNELRQRCNLDPIGA
jgi:hypothetical protein